VIYCGFASGRKGPIGLSWIALMAGPMSNARMKPEFVLTISFCGSLGFFPGNFGAGGMELVGLSPGDATGNTSNGS
jgi:hypothetical protein